MREIQGRLVTRIAALVGSVHRVRNLAESALRLPLSRGRRRWRNLRSTVTSPLAVLSGTRAATSATASRPGLRAG